MCTLTSTAWIISFNQAWFFLPFASACHHILMPMKYLIWNQESPYISFCCYLNKSASIIFISGWAFLSIYDGESKANTHARSHTHLIAYFLQTAFLCILTSFLFISCTAAASSNIKRPLVITYIRFNDSWVFPLFTVCFFVAFFLLCNQPDYK